MNMYGTESPSISLLVALTEYTIIFILLLTGDFSKAFFYYLAFSATILEFDLFIYGEDASSHVRYSFAMLPLFKDYLRWLLAYYFAFKAYEEYVAMKYKLSKTMTSLKKWLKLLFISGTISITLALLFNDNGVITNSNVYPEVAIFSILQFLVKVSIILTSVFLLCREDWKEQCSIYIQLILISVSLITVIAALLGFVGQYNGKETILIAPLAVAYAPMLILFLFKRDEAVFPFITILSGLAAIIASLVYGGTAIGSKWYLIIILAILGVIVMLAKIRSLWMLFLGSVACLMIVPLIILPVLSFFDVNSYAFVKLDQALTTINVFGFQNTAAWFAEIDESPLQRIDEVHNTLIEYYNKPWFAIFGKGFGGTTQHYTNLLSWSGLDQFSADQIQMKAFYRMHETLAVILLQNGIIGLMFFFKMIGKLLKRLYKTPLAMMALVWFFFYWEYGISLVIGSVIMVLALSEDIDSSPLKIKKKKIRKENYQNSEVINI